jgi:pimeloyl-ACP methyl ester carboxylesterase
MSMDSFRRDDLVFDVRDVGTGATGTVVLLHGFPQDSTAYDGVVPALVDAGLRVLVPDQRGYSPRARPPGRGAYAMGELVADVLALLDAAHVEKAHVVGHDWGGAVAWGVAGRHAHRVASVTVLSTPHPAAMQEVMLRSTQGLRSSYIGGFQLPWVPEALALAAGGALLRAVLTRSGLPGPAAEHYVARMREPGALRAALGWYRAVPLSAGHGPGRIRVPATVVHGTRDPFFAGAAVRETARFVVGDLRTVALDAGHWLPETRAADVSAAVLEQVSRGRA